MCSWADKAHWFGIAAAKRTVCKWAWELSWHIAAELMTLQLGFQDRALCMQPSKQVTAKLKERSHVNLTVNCMSARLHIWIMAAALVMPQSLKFFLAVASLGTKAAGLL